MDRNDRIVSFDQFRRAVRDAPLGMIGSSPTTRTFALLIEARFVDDVAVNHLSGSDHTVDYHDRAASEDPSADDPPSSRMVHVQLDGSSTLSQDGRTTVLRPGDVAFYTSTKPFSLAHGGESLILRAPPSELRVQEGLLDELMGVRLDRERPLVDAMAPLARHLGTTLMNAGDGVNTRMVKAAINMLGAIVVETAGESGHASRHIELDAVLNYVEENLSRPELSVAEIAAANFMSARKLHALFELHETTVAAWVRSRRLHHCRRELADSTFADLTIAQIAARWGFTDAAHFSRAFADRYGASPRAFRTSRPRTRATELSHRTRVPVVRPRADAPPVAASA